MPNRVIPKRCLFDRDADITPTEDLNSRRNLPSAGPSGEVRPTQKDHLQADNSGGVLNTCSGGPKGAGSRR